MLTLDKVLHIFRVLTLMGLPSYRQPEGSILKDLLNSLEDPIEVQAPRMDDIEIFLRLLRAVCGSVLSA